MSSWAKKYDPIYIESEVRFHPRTLDVLRKFPDSNIIEIDDYKDVFQKTGQVFQVQKRSPKLILAQKKDNFLYPGSEYAPNFHHPHFFYNTLVMNCLYNCDYCYLQGMYKSSNVVLFVNEDDFFKETDAKLNELGSMYLCISYDTDLLAFEHLFGYCKDWIEFARSRPSLLVELRTKSNNFSSLRAVDPISNFILAWTLSPQSNIKSHEALTPSLSMRLENIREAMDKGWKVRICLDPVLHTPHWRDEYKEFWELLQNKIDLNQIHDLSFGLFRIQKDYLKNMKKGGQDSAIVHYPFETKDGIATYPKMIRGEMELFFHEMLSKTIPNEKIHFLSID